MRRFPLAALAVAATLALSALPAAAQSAASPAATATPAAVPAPGTTGGAHKAGMAAAAPMAPVNVNTATEAQLDAVPQIGPKRAAAIIAHRPYKTTDELVSKKALGQGVYNKVKGRLTVG